MQRPCPIWHHIQTFLRRHALAGGIILAGPSMSSCGKATNECLRQPTMALAAHRLASGKDIAPVESLLIYWSVGKFTSNLNS